MNSSILVDIFFIISLLVFLTTLCIILPSARFDRKAVLKSKGDRYGLFIIKNKRTRVMNWFFQESDGIIE